MFKMWKIETMIKANKKIEIVTTRKRVKTQKNRGSATIEITLLLPIFLGCIYFYIMLFLFFMESGKVMQDLTEYLYVDEKSKAVYEARADRNFVNQDNGKIMKVQAKEKFSIFIIDVEISKDSNNVLEDIRRWQLAAELL